MEWVTERAAPLVCVVAVLAGAAAVGRARRRWRARRRAAVLLGGDEERSRLGRAGGRTLRRRPTARGVRPCRGGSGGRRWRWAPGWELRSSSAARPVW